MKIKYIYQQFLSHISIIVVAFLILSLLFAHYVENLVYQNKVEELTSYGQNILKDFQDPRMDQEEVLLQYHNVLVGRNIHLNVFDENGMILFPREQFGPRFKITEAEWEKITKGKTVVVKQDLKRFEQDVSLVALPYLVDDILVGGILLTSPISGSREMISQINQYLLYTVLIALAVSFLLSWVLSKIHVNRIKRIQEATSLVSTGDYTVKIDSSNFDEIGELAQDFNHMVAKLNDSNEEIESLENRRRQFMADVSHELRTPLTTISGVIEGLRNNMIAEEEKEKGINLVSKETKRLIRLVNENLDYEKIRSNQVKLIKENIELYEVLEIIKDQLDLLAEEKNNQLLIDVADHVMVHADYDRLVQIIINIATNSIQFTENGTVWLRGKAGNKETIIEIEDTGIGIDPVEIEKIWRRFYKADLSRTSTPYGEFGLGLSIVKQLVHLHNGQIEVTSEKNKGTKFTIRIPL
ncbi:MAG TPA: HAMP domain-containing sensor histidine kinase [Pseudoneobacillus sp.]|nr:HAMP domain-containing sensor histidine kinase [Pseudoneobacillus sp.]